MSGDFSCRCLVLTITYKEVNPRGERRARNQIRCRVYSRLIVRLITRVILRWFIAMKSRVSECVSRIKRDRLAERRTSPPFDISKELPASFSPMFYAEKSAIDFAVERCLNGARRENSTQLFWRGTIRNHSSRRETASLGSRTLAIGWPIFSDQGILIIGSLGHTAGSASLVGKCNEIWPSRIPYTYRVYTFGFCHCESLLCFSGLTYHVPRGKIVDEKSRWNLRFWEGNFW